MKYTYENGKKLQKIKKKKKYKNGKKKLTKMGGGGKLMKMKNYMPKIKNVITQCNHQCNHRK